VEEEVPGVAGADRRLVRAAVLGSPVSHSLSPALHRAAYGVLGLTWWRYEAIECDAARLPSFLDACGPDWAGLSLTMPLKRSVLPLLDRADPLVTQVGGANTVLLAAAQRLGYNTDVAGMVAALTVHGIGAQSAPAVGPALILGGGATACAALAALRDVGERSAVLAVRDPGRASAARSAAERLGIEVRFRPFEPASLAGARLIVSTVPAGAADQLAPALRELGPAPAAVFDVVYHPWPTRLAAAAGEAGAVVVGGFDMLLHQAARQVELMTGRPAPVAAMRRAGLAELASRGLPDQRMLRTRPDALRLRGRTRRPGALAWRAAKRRTTSAASHLASATCQALERWPVAVPAARLAARQARRRQAGERWPGALGGTHQRAADCVAWRTPVGAVPESGIVPGSVAAPASAVAQW
jgi:shikimate dehydrogenase